MYRLMVSDFIRLFRDKKIIAASFLYFFLADLLETIICNVGTSLDVDFYADGLITDRGTIIPFILAIFTGLFVYTDFREGTIRNKVIAGAKRWEIVGSMVVVSAVFATYLCAVKHVLGLLFGSFYKAGFSDTPGNLLTYTMIHTGSAVAIATLFTVITYLLGTNIVGAFLPIALCVLSGVATMIITNDLFPENGNCRLSPETYRIYNFIDSYLPSTYLDGMPRHGITEFYISIGATIFISLVIGLIIFNRKDLK